MPTTLAGFEAERTQLLQQFQSLGDLRPGSITAMARRCGKPRCHCAQAEDRPIEEEERGWTAQEKKRLLRSLKR
jgi:hypothetical protein